MAIYSVLFIDFKVFIWLGSITMVTMYNVTIVMLHAYHFGCVDPILLILKFLSCLKILIPTSGSYLTLYHELSYLMLGMSIFIFDTE